MLGFWLEVFGWAGSLFVVVSLTLSNLRRFRVLNLVGCIIATVYNAIFLIWPYAAMNAAIAVINVYWLIRLHREKGDQASYEVVPVEMTDTYLQHVLHTHEADIRQFFPEFAKQEELAGDVALLILLRTETVGIVIVRDAGEGVGIVDIDYVTERYRDFTPGKFVYGESEIFTSRGFNRLIASPEVSGLRDYLEAVGFHERAGEMTLELSKLART